MMTSALRMPSLAEVARDPNTAPERLVPLATDLYDEVMQNPAITLLRMEHPPLEMALRVGSGVQAQRRLLGALTTASQEQRMAFVTECGKRAQQEAFKDRLFKLLFRLFLGRPEMRGFSRGALIVATIITERQSDQIQYLFANEQPIPAAMMKGAAENARWHLGRFVGVSAARGAADHVRQYLVDNGADDVGEMLWQLEMFQNITRSEVSGG